MFLNSPEFFYSCCADSMLVWELTLSFHAHRTDSQPGKKPGTSFIVCNENKPQILVSYLNDTKINSGFVFTSASTGVAIYLNILDSLGAMWNLSSTIMGPKLLIYSSSEMLVHKKLGNVTGGCRGAQTAAPPHMAVWLMKMPLVFLWRRDRIFPHPLCDLTFRSPADLVPT
jgi:hypothetical protein